MTVPQNHPYEIRIHRDTSSPITREEWAAVVAVDPELSWSEHDQLDVENEDGTVEQLTAVDWLTGDSSCDLMWCWGVITTYSPVPEAIEKMVRIARKLGATVVGECGEQYPSNGNVDP